MILKRARIVNFRSLRNVEVTFSKQTAILGGNGAGKSTILKAIEKFYAPSAGVTPEDFFGKDLSVPIEIGLTFSDFNESEQETFESRIVDGEMNVVRVFDLNAAKSSGRYYGFIRGNPAFAVVRNAEGATPKRTAYSELRKSDADSNVDLPAVGKADEIEQQLAAWETAHPEACSLIRDDGQFLGFTNVARGSLSKSTSFVFIPAVRDASADALDKGSSPIARLMELVVKSAVQRRKDFQEWREKTAAEYRTLVNPENLQELGNLATQLTESLRVFYENTAVNLEWQPAGEFQVPLPGALVSLEDGGFQAAVERQGNGLQRAFILTLLQHLAKATVLQSQSANESVTSSPITEGADGSGTIESLTAVPAETPLIPGLILAIEEPELYQHPTKQRHFAHVLSHLSDGSLPGVATNTQIIFASHSPYFVSTDNFDQIRLARRCSIPDNAYQECRLREATLKEVRQRLENAYQPPAGTFTDDALRSRLHIITPEVAEGFFAELVVLVEGESDRAALRAVAAVKSVHLESLGIAVLPASGKFNIDRPVAIFQSLGIPVYAIWDCDKRSDKVGGEETNRALQRLFSSREADIVSAGTRIEGSFACFEDNLEKTLDQEIGQESRINALEECKAHFSIVRNEDALKSPAAMSFVLGRLAEQGKTSDSLEKILEGICAMRAAQIQ